LKQFVAYTKDLNKEKFFKTSHDVEVGDEDEDENKDQEDLMRFVFE